ncbi:MAG: uracil-DNA glycosylase [Candidatus Melainabacteria bacterium]|nr:uracil-DNA glycosylase [Candidatus Melainabacteria bacterium]
MEMQLNLFSIKEESSEHSALSTQHSAVETKYNSLEEAKVEAMKCTKCALCKGRTRVVFSDGNEKAKIMIVGEGPGENEDLQGLPFVGRAGQLLDKIFASVDLNRQEHLYICNIVKCRPPNNRAPLDEEADACWEYLEAQIKYTDPKIIILAGAVAVKGILKIKDPKITKIRGEWIEGQGTLLKGRKLIPIFHPSYLLRHEWNTKPDSPKSLMWKDIQEIKKAFEAL